MDRRPYAPDAWFAVDAAAGQRRRRAALPADLTFQTKHALATAMIRAVTAAGTLPYQWITADAAYGEDHDLRQLVAGLGKRYCFEVRRSAEVWTTDPSWQIPAPPRLGHPGRRRRPTAASPTATRAGAIAASLPASAWIRWRVTEGAKGPREYEFARLRLIEKQHGVPRPAAWLVLHRRVGSPAVDAKAYLSNGPETVSLADLAWVASCRWTIEENFELAKGEVGLDHYEVTKYRGWMHHVSLSLLALAFLKSVQWRWGKKGVS